MVEEYLGSEFKERVLAALRDIKAEVENVDGKLDELKDNEISKIKVEIGMLKVKAGVWGLVGGGLMVFMLILGKRLGL
jgi:uncharacterized protein YlxW (UPF0749 family)